MVCITLEVVEKGGEGEERVTVTQSPHLCSPVPRAGQQLLSVVAPTAGMEGAIMSCKGSLNSSGSEPNCSTV